MGRERKLRDAKKQFLVPFNLKNNILYLYHGHQKNMVSLLSPIVSYLKKLQFPIPS